MAFSQPDILPWLPALYPTPKKWSEAHSPRIPLLFLSAQESKRFIFLSPSLWGNFASGKTERNTSGYFCGESAFSGRKKKYPCDISVVGIEKKVRFCSFFVMFLAWVFFLFGCHVGTSSTLVSEFRKNDEEAKDKWRKKSKFPYFPIKYCLKIVDHRLQQLYRRFNSISRQINFRTHAAVSPGWKEKIVSETISLSRAAIERQNLLCGWIRPSRLDRERERVPLQESSEDSRERF